MNELIKKSEELAKKHEDLINEIMNSPEIKQEDKDAISKIHQEFKDEKNSYDKRIKENQHRKIIGYDPENFEPIYEKE